MRVIKVQVLGKYMIIGYLDPYKGVQGVRFSGLGSKALGFRGSGCKVLWFKFSGSGVQKVRVRI